MNRGTEAAVGRRLRRSGEGCWLLGVAGADGDGPKWTGVGGAQNTVLTGPVQDGLLGCWLLLRRAWQGRSLGGGPLGQV